MPTLAIGLDYFNIKVNNVISQPSTQGVIDQAWAGIEPYKSRVMRDPATGLITEVFNPLGNNGTIEAQGIDLDMRYREKLGPGVLAMTLNGTYYIKFNQSDAGTGTSQKVATMIDPTGTNPVISSTAGLDGFGVVAALQAVRVGDLDSGRLGHDVGQPVHLGLLRGCRLGCALGDPDALQTDAHADADAVGSAGGLVGRQELGADAGCSKHLRQAAGRVLQRLSNQFQSGYDPSQYDPRGRFVYLTGTFKFWMCLLGANSFQRLAERCAVEPWGAGHGLPRPTFRIALSYGGLRAGGLDAAGLNLPQLRGAGIAGSSAPSTASWSRALFGCPLHQ